MSGSANFANGSGMATFHADMMAATVLVVSSQGRLYNKGRTGSAAFSNGSGNATFREDVAEVSLESAAAAALPTLGLPDQGRSGAAGFRGGTCSATFNAAAAAVAADLLKSADVHAARRAVVAPSADSYQGKSGSAVFANGTGN